MSPQPSYHPGSKDVPRRPDRSSPSRHVESARASRSARGRGLRGRGLRRRGLAGHWRWAERREVAGLRGSFRAQEDAITARNQRQVGVSGPFASFQVRVPRRMGEWKGLCEGRGALVVEGWTLGAGRWGRALRSGVERVQRAWMETESGKMETLEPWLVRACLGLEVLVWEETALREERETVGIEGRAAGLEWFSKMWMSTCIPLEDLFPPFSKRNSVRRFSGFD